MATKKKETNTIDLETSLAKILTSVNPYLKYSYSIIFHTQQNELPVTQIVSFERMRDYANNIGDYVLLTCRLHLGDYVKVIHPERDYLMCTVSKEYDTKGTTNITEEYKVAIVDDKKIVDSIGSIGQMTRDELNRDGFIEVEFQLYHLAVEALKQVYVDGIYKECNVQNLMGGLFEHWRKQIKLNGKTMEFKISIVEPANKMDYEQIIIPTGLTLINLPDYIQHGAYGVYNGDIGTYYQNHGFYNALWIYPIYTAERFDKDSSRRKLVIYKANNSRFDVVENTYSVKDTNIEIIAGTNTVITESAANNIIDKGDSILTPTNAMLLNREMEVTDEEIKYDKKEYFTGTNLIGRADKLKKSIFVPSTPNLYKTRSDLARQTMTFIQIPWNFSNDDFMYPGMPVEFVSETSLWGIVKQHGTLMGIFTKYNGELRTTSSMIFVAVKSVVALKPKEKK